MVGALGQVVTLSFQARISGTSISNVKAVVLAWSGTADTVTSDVVSAWGADGVTPTFATNWTAENTPSNLAVTSSWATYRIQATIDTANTKNLAVFIWCDDTTTTLGDFLYLTDIQLEIGAVASPFERRSYGEELAFCQRYYFRWTSESAFGSVMIAALWSTTAHYGHMRFPVTMRVNPTTGGRSNAGDFLGYWYATTFATATAVTVDTGTATTNTIEVQFTFATGTTSSASFIRGSSSAWIEVGAEL